jgi:hypothetical protein
MGNCGHDRPGGKMRDTYGTNKGQIRDKGRPRRIVRNSCTKRKLGKETCICWTGYSSVSVVGTLEGALVEIMSLDAILT